MHVRTENTFSVFELFLHDFDVDLTVGRGALAYALSSAVREHTGDPDWAVRSPEDSGLDRFTLAHGSQCWTKKCATTQEVRALLPLPIVEFLRSIDKLDWTLSYERITDCMRTPRLTPTIADAPAAPARRKRKKPST